MKIADLPRSHVRTNTDYGWYTISADGVVTARTEEGVTNTFTVDELQRGKSRGWFVDSHSIADFKANGIDVANINNRAAARTFGCWIVTTIGHTFIVANDEVEHHFFTRDFVAPRERATA